MKIKYLDFIILLLAGMFVQGCDMIESSPYDVHVTGEKRLTEKNIALIEKATAGKETIKFAMISDSQRFFDETWDAVKAINSRDDIDFVLHGGDVSEYGATREFLWQRDLLNRLDVPYVCVIGNHDCIATGVEAYRAVFGELNFSFTAGDVKFLCLNTNALEFDGATPVPDLGFIKRELASLPPQVRRTVVLMHAGPYSEQFNNDIAEEFEALIRRFPGLQFCLFGHGHNVKVEEPFGDGVVYYECASTRKRSMLVFTLNPDDSYDYEVVDF